MHTPKTTDSDESADRLSVRVLVVALSIQLIAGGAFIWAAASHFSILDGAFGSSARIASSQRFDEQHAFAELRREVAYGPRPAGSPALRRLAVSLRDRLPNGRFEPFGSVGLQNIVGVLPGRLPAIVIGAHYDTKDIPGFLGANDGAAGTAAVLEAARVLRGARRGSGARELRFVLFDGEESPAGTPDFYASGDRGSREYVRVHRREVGSMILLDFIAQRGLRIPREAGSDARLWSRLRAAASRVGAGRQFPPGVQPEVLDDHTPFARSGIPSIDLIDFRYACFHALCDTPAQLSPASLGAAGAALVELLKR